MALGVATLPFRKVPTHVAFVIVLQLGSRTIAVSSVLQRAVAAGSCCCCEGCLLMLVEK